MRIEEEYVKAGFFWLPEKEKNKVPGTLTIKDGGEIELEIVGHFDDSINSLNGGYELGRVIGDVEKDRLVTLEGCYYSQRVVAVDGISKSKVHAIQALIGVAYDKDEDVTFNSLSFSIDCLDEWVGVTGFKVKSNLDTLSTIIRYTLPEDIVYQLDNGMKLEICFSCILPGSPNITQTKVTQSVQFKLSSEKLLPLADFTSVAHKLTTLICFAADTTVTLKGLKAISNKIQRDLGGGKTRPVSIRVYYQSIPYVEKRPSQDWYFMLFNFAAIEPDAQVVFNNWISAYDTLAPALNLYFSTQTGAQKYIDGKFLALVQGLETYHRRISDEKLMSSKEFDLLVSQAVTNFPDDHVDWLKGRLMHGNEINLGKRMKKIAEPCNDYLGTSKQRKKLLKKIVDTRNYLSHYSADLESEAAKGGDLWVLCCKMELMFQLNFLKIIGFNNQEIKDIVTRNFQFNHKASQTLS